MLVEKRENTSELASRSETLLPGSRILVVCDGADEDWRIRNGKTPLVGGVKRFAEAVVPKLRQMGYDVDFLHPYITDQKGTRQFQTGAISMYPELEIVTTNPLEVYLRIRRQLELEKPDAIFITTVEGVLGLATMIACASLNETVEGGKLPYSLAYTTNFDQYLVEYVARHTADIVQMSPEALHPIVRLAYQNADSLLVPTPTMGRRLERMGLGNTVVWPRGVDTELFRPPLEGEDNPFTHYHWYRERPLPILIYFGRLAVEKNLSQFLDLSQRRLESSIGTRCHKVLVGNGPEAGQLKMKFDDPLTHFLGAMSPVEVAAHLRFANCFVFPSLTDTFGNVILEAGSSGVPTVAYSGRSPHGQEIGSQDVIEQGVNGIKVPFGADLVGAVKEALKLNRDSIRRHIETEYSWDKTTQILLGQLKQILWK